MEKQERSKNGFALFLSYFLSFLLTLLVCVVVVAITFCNRSFCKTQVLKSGFCAQVYEELQENYQSYGGAAGFDSTVMTSFISAEQIQSDMFAAVDCFYEAEREIPRHPEIADAAMQAFLADIKARELTVTPDVQEGLDQLAQACAVDYENYVHVMMSTYLAPMLPKLARLVQLSAAFLAVAAAVDIAILFRVKKDSASRLRYVIYALGAVGVFCLTALLIAKVAIPIEKISILPQSAYLFAVTYINNVFLAFLYLGLLCAVVAAALGITLRRITLSAPRGNDED